ncbi:MAG: hypothetical protein ACK5LN_03090, partial [Propioniciclava sp.]
MHRHATALGLRNFRRLLAATVAVLLLECSAIIDPEPRQFPIQPNPSLYAQFRDPFGLLFPPELWGALDSPATAGLLYHNATQSLGDRSTWPHSPGTTFEALQRETTDVEAAYLVVESGLLDSSDDPPWNA